MNGTKKRNIIIGILCAVLLLMVVGYAAFNSVLKINGTTSISSNWDIKITSITSKVLSGTPSNTKDPEGVGTLTASFETDLVSPGDSMEYTITVTNNGTIDANLEKITMSQPDNEYVAFTAEINGEEVNAGENTNFTEETKTLTAGANKDIKVTVTFKDVTINKMEPVSSNLTLTLDYAQIEENNVTPSESITINDLKSTAVTSGDGLYEDTTETGRHIYKGANPNNYITFNNETWRILSVESDGTLKIIRNEKIGNISYDSDYSTSITGVTSANSVEGTRYTATSTDYCYYNSGTESQYYGCNVWGSKTTMLDANGNNITKMPRQAGNSTLYDLPEKEAYLNTYLNNTWYQGLREDAKALVDTHTWNVGLLKNQSGQTLETDLAQESAYKWRGKVGLINTTDYVKTNTNTSLCGNVYANTSSAGNYATCKTTTWLFNNNSQWTMSPYSNSFAHSEWSSTVSGYFYDYFAKVTSSVRPVLHLNSNITLKGKGTETNPYIIN